MWIIFLTYAAIFIGMAAVTLLLPGLLIGLNHACKHVYGISNDALFGYTPHRVMGLIPASILGVGMCALVGGIFGVELAELSGVDPLLPLKVCAVFGICTILLINSVLWFRFRDEDIAEKQLRWIYRIASYAAGAMTGQLFFGAKGLAGGLMLGLLVGKSVGVLVYGYALLAFPIATRIIMPVIIRTRFSTIICNRCLRWTQALKSRYAHGVRHCEHCGQPVEHTPNPGTVVLTFGDIRIPRTGRIFLLANPDFEHKDHRIDISEVYLDTPTCDRRLLERCITYILNFPPRDGLASIQVVHRGALEQLGQNLANTLRNNFTHIEEFRT